MIVKPSRSCAGLSVWGAACDSTKSAHHSNRRRNNFNHGRFRYFRMRRRRRSFERPNELARKHRSPANGERAAITFPPSDEKLESYSEPDLVRNADAVASTISLSDSDATSVTDASTFTHPHADARCIGPVSYRNVCV